MPDPIDANAGGQVDGAMFDTQSPGGGRQSAAALDAEEFATAFRRWVSSLLPVLDKDEVVSLDGKTSRRPGKPDATPLHLVSAFATGAGLVLGQRATAEKTAIPELLATLALTGCIVTIDAMGTQPTIAQAIRDRGADTAVRLIIE